MQSQPRCLQCADPVDDPVYEAGCGHDGCPSSVFHPLCLFAWREEQDNVARLIREAGVPDFDTIHQTMVSAMMKLFWEQGRWERPS